MIKDQSNNMNENPLEYTKLSKDFILFRPTREMVRSRTLELAALDGRETHQISQAQADYEQAQRELTVKTFSGRRQVIFDGLR
jgi:hypothetical protein